MCSNFQSSHEPCKGVSNHFLHQTFYNEAGVQGHMTDELIISSVGDTAFKQCLVQCLSHRGPREWRRDGGVEGWRGRGMEEGQSDEQKSRWAHNL